MAGIWFKPENIQGKLHTPFMNSSEPGALVGGERLFFHCTVYWSSSLQNNLVTLATFRALDGVIAYTTKIYIDNGILKVSGDGNSYSMQAITTTPLPIDQVVELSVSTYSGWATNPLLIKVNGIKQTTTTNYHNSGHYIFRENTQVILLGDENQLSNARGVLLLDALIMNNNHEVSGLPDSASLPSGISLWRSDFEDQAKPLEILITKDSVETGLLWTNTDSENVIWHDDNSPPLPSSTGGIIIPGNGNTTHIQGVIKEDDQPVARRVFAITQAQLEVAGSDETKHAVLNSVLSDENNGSYSLNTSPYEGEVLVLAMDDFGQIWQADTAYAAGDVIRPSTFQGYVYLCTSGGTTDSTEPTWWFDTEQSYAIGTAQFKAKPYNRPLAHGPILPEIIPES